MTNASGALAGARLPARAHARLGTGLETRLRSTAPHEAVGQHHLAWILAAVLAGAALALLARRGGRRRRSVAAYSGVLALAVAAGTLLVLLPVRSSRSAAVHVTATEQSFVAAINDVRHAHGLGTVATQAKLLRAARAHSDDMVREQYFAHGPFWRRLQSFGVADGDAGEALAWRSSTVDAAAALVQAWLNSPEHRAILLDGRYTQIGVGVCEGRFEGYPDAIVVTADFYRPT